MKYLCQILICVFSFSSFKGYADVLYSTSSIPSSAKTAASLQHSASLDNGIIGKTNFSLQLDMDTKIDFIWIKEMNMWVSKHETTNKQYKRSNPNHEVLPYYSRALDASNQPVVYVSWDDAMSFCSWLNKKYINKIPPGYVFRLPTEKEWMLYAECGKTKRFPWGNSFPPPNNFNYYGEEGVGFFYKLFERTSTYIKGHNDNFVVTAPVEESGKNEWGLYGVGGNVWEWCLDWFNEEKITKSLRGASWYNWQEGLLTITNRSSCFPNKSNPMIGFRVIIASPPMITY